jgi:L-threonylcarbamoyladenylate synthase
MKVFSIKQAQENLAEIVQIIASGGVLVCPSDTTYGLLVDATNEKAVEKLIKLKERPRGKPISIFVNGWEMMEKYVDISKLTPEVRSLLPGSYTVVLPSLHTASSLLEAEDGTVGVRLIGQEFSIHNDQFSIKNESHVIARSASDEAISHTFTPANLVTTLVAFYGRPLTATSANISGGGLCYTPEAFFHQLSDAKKDLVDAVIDVGELPHNPPSTVIHLGSHAPVVLRANDQNYIHHETRVVKNESETADFAGAIYERVKNYLGVKPIVILLDGELGGGKTTWTKYFAEHFGIQGIISPTYTYECEYEVPSLPFSSLRGVENDMKPRSAGSTLLYSDKVGNTIGTIS